MREVVAFLKKVSAFYVTYTLKRVFFIYINTTHVSTLRDCIKLSGKYVSPDQTMFSGIVQTISKIQKKETKNDCLFLTIEKPKGWDIEPGKSICSDGICLTVKKVGKTNYTTELMPETLDKTYFGKVDYKYINLEPSLKLNDLVDGHLVTGHVDAVGKIIEITSRGNSKIYKIEFPKKFAKYVAEKASIAVDGISLTVVDVGDDWFTVSFVDYTLNHTTIGMKKVDDQVHLEFDILAKYLDKLLKDKT